MQHSSLETLSTSVAFQRKCCYARYTTLKGAAAVAQISSSHVAINQSLPLCAIRHSSHTVNGALRKYSQSLLQAFLACSSFGLQIWDQF